MQSGLRDDALTSTSTGTAVRIALTWIRSLPLACVKGITVTVDGIEQSPSVVVGERRLAVDQLIDEEGWWYLQDRLVLELPTTLAIGEHDVVVVLQVMIPYLMAGPGGSALELPLRASGRLELDHPPVSSVSLDVA